MSFKKTNGFVAAGLLAGFIGGIAGAGAKLIGEAIYPPRIHGEEPPPAVLAERLAGHPLSDGEKTVATQIFHWSTSAAIGAIYGAVAEVAPIVTIGHGVGFGVVVMLATHESTLPLLGLDDSPARQPLRKHTSELATHALFGFVVELVRRWLMRRWHPASV